MTDLSPRTAATDDAVAPRRPRRKWASTVVLGLVLVAGGVLVTQFLRSAVDYYCNVDEVGARGGCEADRRLRIQGIVEAGTVQAAAGNTAFVIRFNGAELPVQYAGEPGGIFKECIPVVVHGELDGGTGVFHGDRVEVKHSNEYVAVNDDRLDEAEQLAADCAAGD
ncbi:MAG TPA: cytochrome c maturation protein CcmE [Ilumatobacter sp.]|nr:cytochrome c maturation protein CcmE [Ilumatobacter sp.]